MPVPPAYKVDVEKILYPGKENASSTPSTGVSAAQGNLFRGSDNKTVEDREFQFVHICSLLSNTVYKETKWFKIAVFFNK